MIRARYWLAPFVVASLLFGEANARSRQRSRPPPRATEPKTASIWSSPEACSAALARGERRLRAPGTARLASWNVRWFPDGIPGNPSERGEKATDVAWLACA